MTGLQKSTVSINLGNGIDQKDDNKVGAPNSFIDLKDWVWNKMKRLDKRPGTVRHPTTVSTSYPNPLSIGSSNIPSNVLSHKDQLLLQNKGVLYSYSEDQEKWIFKNHFYPVTVDPRKIVATESFQYNPDGATINGKTVVAYSVAVNAGSVTELRYCVIEESTGNYLVDDQVVSTVDNSLFPRILTFSNKCYIIWKEPGVLKIREVNTTDGSLGTATTLKTDLSTSARFDVAHTSASSLVGEAWFVAYETTFGEIKIFPIDSSGSIASLGTKTITLGVTLALFRPIGIHIDPSVDPNRLYVSYQMNTSGGDPDLKAASYTFTASVYTTAFAPTSIYTPEVLYNGNYEEVQEIGFCHNPNASTEIFVFFGTQYESYFTSKKVYENRLRWVSINNSGSVVNGPSILAPGGNLVAKPLKDTSRNTIYLAVSNDSLLQATDFVLDFMRGISQRSMFVLAKFNYAKSQGKRYNNVLSGFTQIESGKYQFFHGLRTRAVNDTLYTNGYQIGVAQNVVNFEPEYAASSRFLAENTHLTGGFHASYDGSNIAEHGFFLDPENMEAGAYQYGAKWTTIDPGGASARHTFTVEFVCGAALWNGGGTTPQWTFGYGGTNAVVWYYFPDEANSGPAPSSTTAKVTVYKTDTREEIAAKTLLAIGQLSGAPSYSTLYTTTPDHYTAQFRATANGTGTLDFGSMVRSGASRPLTAGTFQVTAIFTWVDTAGQIQKSAPLAPITFTCDGSNSYAGYVINYKPFTCKTATQVRVELYRTIVNGSTFHKVQAFYLDPFWNTAQGPGATLILKDGRCWVIDTTSDTDIANNEILYTDGGVQENMNIGACSAMAVYKNRLWVVPADDKTSIYYSKTIVNGSPVEFTPFNFISLNSDNEPINGLEFLDGNLVAGKKKTVFIIAGDGANDLGVGSTLSQPQAIATDTGVVSQNSMAVTPMGLWFDSNMGRQILSRGGDIQYLGLQVEDYNEFKVAKAVVLKDDKDVREVRFILQGTTYTLVYSYIFNSWTVFSQYGGTDACLWKGAFVRVDSSGYVYREDKTIWIDDDSAVETYNPTLTTQWLKVKNVQDFQRVYRLMILGALKSAHILNFKVYYDYDDTNFDQYNFDSSNISGSNPGDSVYQPEIHLARQKCQAIKIEMTVQASGGSEECLTLTDLSFQVGVKQGLNKVKAGKKL
jgi:hypothetical protein